ncbi:MAG TPA: TlyA family RNA methyltransferase [Thermomicrobiales bacterium]|nr:TlyA family RNA methyltransferase [Thermomicrobiales bacterium]
MAKAQRLDIAVVERGLADTRSRAKALIMAGDVLVNGQRETRAGHNVNPADDLALREKPRFVSRGGEKLDHALTSFEIDVAGHIAADLGASTGGFTDCLLQRGVARVYAVDVGYGQLDERVRTDRRVVSMERTNARYLEDLPEPVDLVVIDVSFISLALIFPVVDRILKPGGRCVPLIKPQFEAGRDDVGKGGVVRDPAVHEKVLRAAIDAASESHLATLGLVASPLRGPAGNVEFLAHLVQGEVETRPDEDALVGAAMAEVAAVAEGAA